jgi:hypothetical protein
MPDTRVVLEAQLLVEETIDRAQLLKLRLFCFALQHLIPGLDPSFGRAEGTITLLGGLQDQRKIPVRPDTALAG